MNDKKEDNRNPYIPSRELTGFIVKATLGAFLFIAGFNFANTAFFAENPLFGVKFLAETLISIAAGLFGYHTIPLIITTIKNWLESYISNTVSNIVWDFWEQQTKRMQVSRRSRQKEKKKDTEKKMKDKFAGGVFLDTSILIDGRITELVQTGFFPEPLVITQSVIDELHLISDSEDALKRQRGRRGLDIIDALKKDKGFKLEFCKTEGHKQGVDKELVILCKKNKAHLMTLDFNLNKVAKVAGVKVLNLNALVDAVKPAVLPGEHLKDVKIVQKGKEKSQGVGYMPDGTMIVVENGKDLVGKKVNVKVSRLIQTPAGKMVFSVLEEK